MCARGSWSSLVWTQMLIRLNVLLGENPTFQSKLAEQAVFLCGGTQPRLCRANQLFDPAVTELVELLDPSCFPADGDLRRPDSVVALRSLGMRTTLSRAAVRRVNLSRHPFAVVVCCCCFCCCRFCPDIRPCVVTRGADPRIRQVC